MSSHSVRLTVIYSASIFSKSRDRALKWRLYSDLSHWRMYKNISASAWTKGNNSSSAFPILIPFLVEFFHVIWYVSGCTTSPHIDVLLAQWCAYGPMAIDERGKLQRRNSKDAAADGEDAWADVGDLLTWLELQVSTDLVDHCSCTQLWMWSLYLKFFEHL